MTTILSSLGTITLNFCEQNSPWNATLALKKIQDGIEEITLDLNAPEEIPPSPFELHWALPLNGIQARWTPNLEIRNLPPTWNACRASSLAFNAPVMALMGQNGKNALTFAFSDALRYIEFQSGINEYSLNTDCCLRGFQQPEAPKKHYQAKLLLNTRPVFYADALRDVSAWYAAFPEYTPCVPPDKTRRPMYSSWYSYHRDIHDTTLEQECGLAREYGMESIIVDDGWQVEKNSGSYAFCGDWEPAKSRFPDMRAHVDRVHALGLKYLLWFSVPFVGIQSKAFSRFQGKFLHCRKNLNVYILDPRFPEVREYLINIYEHAVRDWDLDGCKLDFIESFPVPPGTEDPAVRDNYAGRDIKTVPEAVDRLLMETMRRLRAIKPDIMIEFRQAYIGPSIRKYGNIFRASDCPGDILLNRIRTLDLRLFSGTTTVHSDMLAWHKDATPEEAALQILNILFSVPQISMRLAELTKEHRSMLKFWLDFWNQHRETLLDGHLTPMHPEQNYPLVAAETEKEQIVVVYEESKLVDLTQFQGNKRLYIINATSCDSMVLKTVAAVSGKTLDACGKLQDTFPLSCGLQEIRIPRSGLYLVE